MKLFCGFLFTWQEFKKKIQHTFLVLQTVELINSKVTYVNVEI